MTIVCRWCEEPIHSNYVSDSYINAPVWIHEHSYGNRCHSSETWDKNYGDHNYDLYGPSVATPDIDPAPHPRQIRAAERGLRNLLRNL